ncbi:MAG: hypothetical protein K2N53_06925, partial [Clostridia bacterium]|nr:hypothetical protein [Clostridia bacterium]
LKERAARENILNGYEHESVLSSGENFDGTDSLQVEEAYQKDGESDVEAEAENAEVTTDETASEQIEDKEV